MSEPRKPLLAANWKLNPTTGAEADQLVKSISAAAAGHVARVEVAVFPPFPWLARVSQLAAESGLGVGAQDCFWEPSGAYTGEVSARMLAGWCGWVIVGHSERRARFGDTDEWVARKAAAGLEAGLAVIICVGELDEHFQAGHTERVVRGQVEAALRPLEADHSPRLVIAYEPVWAIGSGRNADPEHAYRTMRLIRQVAAARLGEGAAGRLRVLYGGSVKADNVESYVELPSCDGCLVGGASLDATEFSRMVGAVAGVYAHLPAPERGG